MTTLPLALLLAAQTFANATVVSTDPPGRTLTVSRNGGAAEVLAVDVAALPRLQELKAGDEVILTLRGAEGTPPVVTLIEPSLRGTRPARRYRPGATRASPAPGPSPTPRPGRTRAVSPKASPTPGTGHLPTDTVGPLQDPRKGAQQDPRDNPRRDPRVIPGLTEAPPAAKASPSPSPSPTPTPGA
jgi:hypothetical protein